MHLYTLKTVLSQTIKSNFSINVNKPTLLDLMLSVHSKNKNVKFEPKLVEFDLVPRNHSSK